MLVNYTNYTNYTLLHIQNDGWTLP